MLYVCVCVYLTNVPLWFGQRSHAIEMVLRARVGASLENEIYIGATMRLALLAGSSTTSIYYTLKKFLFETSVSLPLLNDLGDVRVSLSPGLGHGRIPPPILLFLVGTALQQNSHTLHASLRSAHVQRGSPVVIADVSVARRTSPGDVQLKFFRVALFAHGAQPIGKVRR